MTSPATPAPRLAATLAPASREQLLTALWRMTAAEQVAAMWRRELTPLQLLRWSSRRPYEVPLLGGEFAWIVMDTPEMDVLTSASKLREAQNAC